MHGSKRYRFDDETRKKWQDPEEILRRIGLLPGMVFVDVGCGEGFFSVPASRIVGHRGRIYAFDINAEEIGRLEETAEREGLGNIVARVGEAEKTILFEAEADMVFLGIDLHDFADPAQVLHNAGKMIKPTGRLVDLDWKKDQMDMGPPFHIRFDEAKASRLISEAGFTVEAVTESGPYHYIIIAKPALPA
jgi:ubiquinone/menaquinone biosynthesis C-methylase UbiE